MEDEMSEFQKLRLQNMNALQSMLEEEFAKPEMQEAAEEFRRLKAKEAAPQRVVRQVKKDRNFVFTGSTPLTRRSSSRIANKKPEYAIEDLYDVETEVGILRRNRLMKESFEVDNLEEVVFQQRPKRKSTGRRAEVPFVAAEDVTENYIKNIAWRVIYKEYSEVGTSCHQCRQKTKDSKTYCRSGRCIGIRGQFCGVCLKNRYGEDADVALRDPKWECPPCRNICNCSICRTRQGKMPTGILAPVAQNEGFKSVAQFLKHLQGKGGLEPGEKPKRKHKKIEGQLLGFDEDGNYVMKYQEE